MKTTLALVLLLYLAKLIVFVRLVLIINDWAGSYGYTAYTSHPCWLLAAVCLHTSGPCRLQIADCFYFAIVVKYLTF